MNEQEQLGWKMEVVAEIGDDLLNRGSASIRGVIRRKLQSLSLELTVLRAKEAEVTSVPAEG